MNDPSACSFGDVLAAELTQIAARRQCPGADGFPFADRAGATAAWSHALHKAAELRQQYLRVRHAATLDALPPKQQREIGRREHAMLHGAWRRSWREAVAAGLAQRQHARAQAAVALRDKQLLLSDTALNDEQRAALVGERRECERTLRQADEELWAWQQELDERQRLKKALDTDACRQGRSDGKQTQEAALDQELVGLAFSGGGIRSATFNLGVLQGLAELDLLGTVDYLSTVSGGGYIGSWWTAWLRRAGGLAKVAPLLHTRQRADDTSAGTPADTDGSEQAPIRHLRRHSNYLAPRQGFLSADIWVLWATYLRNFLLNQLVLLPAAIVVLLLVRGLMLLYYPWSPHLEQPAPESIRFMAGFCAATGVGWFLTLLVLFRATLIGTPRPVDGRAPAERRLRPGWLMTLALVFLVGAVLLCSIAPYPLLLDKDTAPPRLLEVLATIVAAMAVAGLAFLLLIAMNSGGAVRRWRALAIAFLVACLAGGVTGAAALGAHWLLIQCAPWSGFDWRLQWLEFALPCTLLTSLAFLLAAVHQAAVGTLSWGRAMRALGVVSLSGLIGGGLLYWVYVLLHSMFQWDGLLALDYVHTQATARVLTVGPPLVLLSLVVGTYAGVGLSKGQMKESTREWWSSVCARLLLLAALWLGLTVVALYATPLVLWGGPWLKAGFASTWLLTVGGGVLAGMGPTTGNARRGNPYLAALAYLTPAVFVVGLLIGVSLLLHYAFDCPPQWRQADERVWPRQSVPERPPNRVLLTQASAGTAKRKDVVERAETIDDSFIVQEMYWFGMLNTDPSFVPRLEAFGLSDADIVRLHKEHHLDTAVLQAVSHLVNRRFLTQQEFDRALDEEAENLPDGLSYADRLLISQYAKNVRWIAAAEAWPAWAFGASIVGSGGTLPGPGTLLVTSAAYAARTGNSVSRNELFAKVSTWLIGSLALLLLAVWRVDVNLFSLHALYANRLVRAYLGASRTVQSPDPARQRCPDPITGLDAHDDLRLSELAAPPFGPEEDRRGYDGPYPLLNTALNLVHGEDLAWQERKAEAFLFAPRFCGSETTGYRLTADAYPNNVTLGNAVTLSGAAASPNMGYHSSPAVTVLLTVFNARLGAWVGNPRDLRHWRRHGPWFGFWNLFWELFGFTDDKAGYVYLSDGGHFENLGVYELVRRRCRYVIVADAGQDAAHGFEDLGNLIRKCRVDFGIRIEIDLNALRLQGDPGRSRWHCAVGKIHYEDVHERASPGILVYLKPSLTGDEPTDVLHYAESHPTFPHEATGNQFYTESQFESYRALGYHVAKVVFEPAASESRDERAPANEKPCVRRRRRCRALFASAERRWFALPPELETGFVQATEQFIAIQETIRTDTRLWRLSYDLYPDCAPGPQRLDALERAETDQEAVSRQRAELHAVTQMLQVMENAWLSLQLDVHYAHPMNRGWIDVFHRWTSAGTLRRHWPVLRSEFARGFVSFCEKQMRLGEVEGVPIRLMDTQLSAAHRQRLCVEFRDQWPDAVLQIDERLRRAEANRQDWAWLVYMKNSYPGDDEARPDALPCGLIHISHAGHEEPGGGRPAVVYDLFMWMRGAYRNAGLGRAALRTVLTEFRAVAPESYRLRVRLPVKGLTGPGGVLQREMWLTFFYNFGFERVAPPSAPPGNSDDVAAADIALEQSFTATAVTPTT